MIHRFATFETAALFATLKRDQGYFAEVLHEHVGFLWGPLAMSGFSVLVSEFAADDGEEVPAPEPSPPSAFDELSAALVCATLAIPAVSLLWIVVAILRDLIHYPQEMLIVAVVSLLPVAIVIVFLCWFGWWLSGLTRIYRNPDHRFHGVVDSAHAVLAWLLILLRVI